MERKAKFRLNAKKLYLTYSQIDQNVKHGDILKELEKKLVIKEYLIALEKHEDGGLHTHVLLILEKRCDFTKADCLDITLKNNSVHGNYQTAKNVKAIINYLIKDNNFITNMKFEVYEGKIIEPEEFAFLEANRIGITKALKNYKDKYPGKAVKKLVSLKNSLETSKRIDQNLEKGVNDITLNDFNFNQLDRYEELQEWLNSFLKKSLILSGKSGTGKSLLAKALMKELNLSYLRATNYQGLKNLDENHEGFILDDAKTSDLDNPSLINLYDTNEPTDLRLLHQIKTKKQGLVQIFTVNEVKDLIKELIPALSRRVLILNVDKPIINITINNNFYLNNRENEKGNEIAWEKLTGEKPKRLPDENGPSGI